MNRTDAISLILQDDIKKLSKEDRGLMLLECWGIDEEDQDFKNYSKSLQQELLQAEAPVEDVMNPKYDVLLHNSLKDYYYGVKNEYLSELIFNILNKKIEVEGEPEKLYACPCCKYKTISERGEYDICPICFWEDDGNNNPAKGSGPNHMTLGEGQANFVKYGAVSERELEFVNPEAKKYFSVENE
jgi:hypothetical protein